MSVMTWTLIERMRVEHWCKLLQRDSIYKHRDRILTLLPEMLFSHDDTVDTYSINEIVDQYDHEEIILILHIQ